MPASKIVDTDKGMKSFRAYMGRQDRPAVVAGFLEGGPGSQGHGDGGLTVADVAFLNEVDPPPPARPFMELTVEARQDVWNGQLVDVMRQTVDAATRSSAAAGATAAKGLARIGLQMESDIRATIDSSVGPPNADSTIERKGSSGTLIDTGQMKQSVTSEVRKL